MYMTPIVLTASTCYYGRVVPSRNMAITKVAFFVTAADASNPAVDVGVADQTGARLVSMGAATGRVNAGVRVVLTLPNAVFLTAGVPYYAAFASAASASPATLMHAVDGWAAAFGGTIPQLRIGSIASATVPASSGALTAGGVNPVLVLLES